MLDNFPMEQIGPNTLKMLPNMIKICKQTVKTIPSENTCIISSVTSQKRAQYKWCNDVFHTHDSPNCLIHRCILYHNQQ